MTRTLFLPWPIFKELRALSLPWLACALVTIVPTLLQGPRYLAGIQVIAYFLGATVLGAMSIGHEYTDRTLTLLLSVPVRRQRLLVIKLGVLGTMLMTLGVVAYTYVFKELNQEARLAFTLLPVLCGLFIAPWLTMACRSPMAGWALTMAIPGVLAVLAAGIPAWLGDRADGFVTAMAFLRLGTLGMCAIGAVAGWRKFTRLEVIEETGETLQLPQWTHLRTTAFRRSSGRGERTSNGALQSGPRGGERSSSRASSPARVPTKRHPIWLLVTKEIRLQQLAFAVAGLYLFGWLAVMVLLSDVYGDVYPALSAILAALLGMLIGSVASAEERQLGTLEWQVLQPIAMWQQWAVKAGVVLGLAMLLGVGLPTVLAAVGPVTYGKSFIGLQLAGTVLLLTAGSLYVSSLCSSGAWALVISLPAAVGALWFQIVVLGRLSVAAHPAWSGVFNDSGHSGGELHGLGASRVLYILDLLLIAGFIGLVARFALTNHRSADRPPWRICQQVVLMAVFATARVVILSGVAAALGRRW